LIEGVKRAGLPCEFCGFMLLVTEDVVFCQNRDCKNYFKRVILK